MILKIIRFARGCYLINSKGALVRFIIVLSILLISGISYAVECINSRSLFEIRPEVDQPSDISIGPDGDIYLVDGVNNRIVEIYYGGFISENDCCCKRAVRKIQKGKHER